MVNKKASQNPQRVSLKVKDSLSRGPLQVPLLSSVNFWRIWTSGEFHFCQEQKTGVAMESIRLIFLLRHTDGWVANIHGPNLAQAGGEGVMVWGMFIWNLLGLLIPINHCLNCLSIIAKHNYLFITTIYPSFKGCLRHNAPNHKAKVISIYI